MKKTILVFSALIVSLFLVFQLSKYVFISNNLGIEIIIALIAILFFFIGIYINKKSLHKTSEPPSNINHKTIETLGITKREYEVLRNISDGLSNKEIASKLFLSESTIKTYVSSLLVKLDAKRRTQAVKNAKTLQIL